MRLEKQRPPADRSTGGLDVQTGVPRDQFMFAAAAAWAAFC